MNPLIETFRARRCFVLAKLVPRDDGRVDKVPVSIDGVPINAQDPAQWLTGSEASDYAVAFGLGVGIVISEDSGLACVDIDKAWTGTAWAPHVDTILAQFPGAYVEVSQSNTGLHIIFSCTPVPPHKTKYAELHIECYTRARFIYLTGTHASGDVRTDLTTQLVKFLGNYFAAPAASAEVEWTTAPVPQWSGPEDDAELVERAKRSRSTKSLLGIGVSFADLYNGDPEKLNQAYPPQSPGQVWDGSSADLALANMLAFWTGGNAERIEKLMRASALYRPKHDRTAYMRDTILAACASAAARGTYYNDGRKGPVSADDSRTMVQLIGGSLKSNIATLEPLVGGSIYVRGGSLVRIGQSEQVANGRLADDMVESGGTRRSYKQAICIPVTADWLRLELMGLAQFWQYDERSAKWKEKNCPEEIANSIIKQGSWSSFSQLLAISSTPILRSDMSVWTQPGYDAATGIFYQPTMSIPEVIAVPTRDDAVAALARLIAPFSQFPFKTDESKAVFVAHLITAVLRPSFATSPIFVYSAPIVASGKTLLSDMGAIVAQGVNHPAHHSYDEKEELKKVLLSSLLVGDSALTIDNMPEGLKIRSPVLANFVTSGTFGGRVLGLSKVVELPNRCTVTMTGNNITPVGEIARRSLVVRLDVNQESARGRSFVIKNLRSYVRERRAQFIVDVLTVARAYAFARRPEVTKSPLESFEEWSGLVRDPLVWLGMADPVASQAIETDDETGPLRGAFAAMAAATYQCEYKFTTAQLLHLALNPVLTGGVKLIEALENAGCREPREKLGYWLRARKDNIAAGWKLVNEVDVHTGVATWRLQTA